MYVSQWIKTTTTYPQIHVQDNAQTPTQDPPRREEENKTNTLSRPICTMSLPLCVIVELMHFEKKSTDDY